MNQSMTEEDCAQLMAETGLTRSQIKSWMTNARRRRQNEIKRMAEKIKQELRTNDLTELNPEGIKRVLERNPNGTRISRMRISKANRLQRELSLYSDESYYSSDEQEMEMESDESDSLCNKVDLSISDIEDEPPKKKPRFPME